MATRHYSDFVTYTRYRNIATATVRSVKSTFETGLANNIKHNPSLFWKYVRNNSRIRQDVDILLQDDGSFTHTDCEIANTLNKFFASVFTNEPTEEIPVLPDRTNGCSLQNIDLTHQDNYYKHGFR